MPPDPAPLCEHLPTSTRYIFQRRGKYRKYFKGSSCVCPSVRVCALNFQCEIGKEENTDNPCRLSVSVFPFVRVARACLHALYVRTAFLPFALVLPAFVIAFTHYSLA